MRTERRTIYLGSLFIAAVLMPSVILSVISLRSAGREEVFIEKRLEKALMAEVTHASSLVQNELRTIEAELSGSLSGVFVDPASEFNAWKKKSFLIQLPFLLSPDRRIVWPYSREDLSSDELSFLEWGRAFFGGRTSVPLYRNIAVVYRKAILDEAKIESDLSEAAQAEGESWAAGMPVASKESFPLDSMQKHGYEKDYLDQQAIARFQQDAPLRQQVYEKAKTSGRQILTRNITLEDKGQVREKKEAFQESMFIAEPVKFSDMSQNDDSGIIPGFINDSLRLLFWKKNADGSIAGCLIDQAQLRKRLVSVLPVLYSQARILTLLDENGSPLAMPGEDKARDWRKPFVASEISELLPHWEAAVYLVDPEMISSQARTHVLMMWLLTAFLFVSILSGGTMVLRSLNSELRLARQKTTFVANVSHELKTPLTSIRLFAEMLKTKREVDEDRREKYLSLMVSETERLTRLINNVLDFSRRDKKGKSYVMEDLDLCTLCREVIEGQKLRLEHNGFEVSVLCETEQIMVKADPEALKQTLVNLLSNAEKYSPDSKEIEMEIKKVNDRAVLRIKDRGTGIPQSQSHKIFDEFFRADDSLTAKTGGTGLGLTIAKQIIEDHGGEIRYMPRDNGGSVFEITLPLLLKQRAEQTRH